MKKLFCLVFLALMSCTGHSNNYCFVERGFDYEVNSSVLTKINKKILLNELVNSSNIKYSKNSDLKIVLNVEIRKNTSLISSNNSTLIENIDFITRYQIFDSKNLLDSGKIITIDDLNTYDNRFANYAIDNFVMENYAKNLTNKMEGKIELLLKRNSKNCKKLNI